MAGFTVPGFDVDHLMGRGCGGELWAARGRATERPVALRRLVVTDDLATHDRVRRAAARLVGVQHPHLVRLRGVLSVEGAVVLVHDRVAGVSLDRVLAERRSLEEAEIVTVAVPLARALAAVHAAGLVHGRVSPSSVLLSDDGRPMLADTGVAALVSGVDPTRGPPDDVRDLALTCVAALCPEARTGPLAALLSAASVDDAELRPSATELAETVFASRPAAPIRFGSDPVAQRPDPPGMDRPDQRQPVRPATARRVAGRHGSHRRTARTPRRFTSRRWAAFLLAAGAVVAAALTGLAWAGVDSAPPGSSVAAREPASPYDVSAATARWRAVLVALDASRASAFAAVSPARLADVYADDAPALRRDQAQLAGLAAAGLHVERLHLRPLTVRVVARTAQRVVLAVRDVLEPYQIRAAHGALVAARPGRGPASWRVTLVSARGGWRVYDVVAS